MPYFRLSYYQHLLTNFMKIVFSFRMNFRYSNGSLLLREAITNFSFNHCSDPRDRIYRLSALQALYDYSIAYHKSTCAQ
jgi:hypothetical protein